MTTKRLMLYFPRCETEKPIVYHLVKDYNLIINIFRAKVTPDEEGFLVLDLTGTDEDIARGIDWVKELQIEVREHQKGLRWDETLCVSCGNCIPHCPTDALHFTDNGDRTVTFDDSKCVECLSCIENCPYGACSSII
ncbi:4Fe-4S binding protein [Marispirochaeta sp.]|jgi:L-aspartate semialdehyde sulfurtransferase ferredoxin|uniref:4Fe-4S binding protein n=1 Tax=Marispirochaeta sp. TaxID=2038653 RepID=UPI0029C74186|nr:4Fe-4S dicluster domain-containing protein [Marispirochaeta sp.]